MGRGKYLMIAEINIAGKRYGRKRQNSWLKDIGLRHLFGLTSTEIFIMVVSTATIAI